MKKKSSRNKKRVKIKMNGQERPKKPDIPINDWSLAKEESAAAKENTNDEFEWVLPKKKQKDIPELQKKYTPAQLLKKGTGFSKKFGRKLSPKTAGIVLSVLLAITIGLAFGFFVLKIANPAGVAEEGENALLETGAVQQDQAIKVKLPALRVAVVQGGAFTTTEAADRTAKELSEKGYATTTIHADGQNLLFLSVMPGLKNAQEFAQVLKIAGIDSYAKEFSVPEKELKVAAAEESQLVENIGSLFQMLSSEATSAELTGQVEEEKMKEIEESLASIQKYESDTDSVNNLIKSLSTSFEELKNFQETSAIAHVRQAQQALLNYLQLYFEGGTVPAE